jgi:hypothetical protein
MRHEMVLLAPGVYGFTRDDPDGALVIPMIAAEMPGSGDVGRYLDSLPNNRRVIVEAVISIRLAGMLERRGFVWRPDATLDPDTNEIVDGLVREAGGGVTCSSGEDP